MRLSIRYFCLALLSSAFLFSMYGIHINLYSLDINSRQMIQDCTLNQNPILKNNSKAPQNREHHCNINLTVYQFRHEPTSKTGNHLIDEYGMNDMTKSGENGRGITFAGKEKQKVKDSLSIFNMNTLASDLIPLNRKIPDSRPPRCANITYEHDLPTTSVIVPFYNEWPSILLRTVYSIINRTPRHLLQEIILIDDASTLRELKDKLDEYIKCHFPKKLVHVIRLKSRLGLVKARLKGYENATGEVLVFFDSHMEVNEDWLQPLLTEIKKDRHTVAMAVLDYIDRETFNYAFNEGYFTRYGFDWRLVFFETFFRSDQIGKTAEDVRIGTMMVGAGYAIDRRFFRDVGEYDRGMTIWGGENLEMAWRVWLCGGRLVHVPCSHLGHIARGQPYSFPGGRKHIEMYNYKRAIDVWFEESHKAFVYDHYPEMKYMDVGDLSDRKALKEKLKCHNFTWYLDNIWPELLVYNKDVFAWGSARHMQSNQCLDNHQYLFQAPDKLYMEYCHYRLATQGFSWTKERTLRTSLQCVVLEKENVGSRPVLQDCIIGSHDTWKHIKNGTLKHDKTDLCLDKDVEGPVMKKCDAASDSQKWSFNHYDF